MAMYCFRCSGCGLQTERPTLPKTSLYRHINADLAVCGVLKRDYKAENVGVHTANLRKAR